MRSKVSVGEYLAFLSNKLEIDPDNFFSALIQAGKNRKATCGELSITCRGETKDRLVFLMVKGSKVVAQFPIAKDFLHDEKNPIKRFKKSVSCIRRVDRRNADSPPLQIKDLRVGMKQIKLKAKILEIPEPKLVFTRFGNYASVANALIADDTGTVKLCLWNEQINSVSIGDTVEIQNASMSVFRGERQLRIGKKGALNNVGNGDPGIQIDNS